MTLYRQLIIIIFALLTLMLAGVIWLDVDSTRRYLVDQLESHAQDTATSLGLSLSTHIKEKDTASTVAMVDAVFDRGYYKQIIVDDMQGNHLVTRKLDVVVEGVPAWFVSLVPLESPMASALVMSGWNQVGNVRVTSHPGYAYQELWRSVVDTSIWFLVIAVVVLMLAGVALRVLLKPLKAVEHQAEQLARRHYELQEKLPHTRELRSVVIAMNRLTSKIREMFSEQADTATYLRRLAYEDELTGLGNRRLLEDELNTRLGSSSEFSHGTLLLLQVEGLKSINDTEGYAVGDSVLGKVAGVLREVFAPLPHTTIVRLGGGDFAVLLAADTQAASVHCDKVKGKFVSTFSDESIEMNIGIAGFSPGVSREALLAAADNALRNAIATGPNSCAQQPSGDRPEHSVPGRTEVERLLLSALEQKQFLLFVQPVKTSAGELFHRELLIRLATPGGEVLTAGAFLPLANSMGRAHELDRVVLEQVISQLSSGSERTAVNLAMDSVEDRDFVDWLLGQLKQSPDVASRLCFEFSEHAALRHTDALKPFVSAIRAAGCQVGLDHFGRSGIDFSYLHVLHPDYVKIDATFISDLTDSPDRQFLVRSLTTVAHSLDIEVVAEAVESEAQLSDLLAIGVDGVQGYWIGKPEAI